MKTAYVTTTENHIDGKFYVYTRIGDNHKYFDSVINALNFIRSAAPSEAIQVEQRDIIVMLRKEIKYESSYRIWMRPAPEVTRAHIERRTTMETTATCMNYNPFYCEGYDCSECESYEFECRGECEHCEHCTVCQDPYWENRKVLSFLFYLYPIRPELAERCPLLQTIYKLTHTPGIAEQRPLF